MNQCIKTTADPARFDGRWENGESDEIKPWTARSTAAGERGFTLLEVILGLGLITMLIGGIYSIATASLQLSNSVLETQADDMHMHAFINLLRRNIQGLPGNAQITMEEPNTTGSVYQSELVLDDYPLAFSWGAVAAGSKKVILATEKDSRGGLQFRVRYLNEEETESYEGGNLGLNDGISLILIDGLRGVLWEFYNQQTDEWLQEWIQPNQRPTMISLSMEFYAVADPIRTIFWIPTVANPAQITQTAGQTPGTQPQPGTPGGDQPGPPGGQPPGGGGAGRPDSRSGGGTRGGGGRGGSRSSSGGGRPSFPGR